MPKNVETIQLHSFHMLARLCWKSFKLGFSSIWTENFQMYKLGFKEAEGPKIKLLTFAGSWRKQGSSRKPSTSVSLTMLKAFECMDHNTLWKIFKRWKYQTTFPDSQETCRWVKYQQVEPYTETPFHNWQRSTTMLYIVTLLIYLI